MKEVSEVFDSLTSLSKNSCDNKIVTESFKLLSNNMRTWKNTVEKQINYIDNYYLEFFTYIRKEYTCFEDVTD